MHKSEKSGCRKAAVRGETPEIISTLTPALSRRRERADCYIFPAEAGFADSEPVTRHCLKVYTLAVIGVAEDLSQIFLAGHAGDGDGHDLVQRPLYQPGNRFLILRFVDAALLD